MCRSSLLLCTIHLTPAWLLEQNAHTETGLLSVAAQYYNNEAMYRGYPNIGVKALRCRFNTSLLIFSMHLCTGLSLTAIHPVSHKSPHCQA